MKPPEDHSIFAQAIWFAAEAHCNTYRKQRPVPYIIHPMEVAVIVSNITVDPEVLAAAVLHDVVEDTSAEIEDVERMFGSRVAAMVAAETEDKMKDRDSSQTWMERKTRALEYLENTADKNVQIIALADKLSNMRSLSRMFRQDPENFLEGFNQKDSRKVKWFYLRALEALSSFRDTDEWKELSDLVREVFG
ncbi:MAG: bifunctional (p)ppGpp synthetase/guanosine-3',5'-bis(diphosphate) 3'-pyrophosphohydrolase [Oscillospiraceae bacterium]|nr:bifunctional (p)ppGpp synthetase/guanosine-3',5'-bis(diphosphate) 3'-pyrophosphohydrolase [Oscillospiraceae bacterium]